MTFYDGHKCQKRHILTFMTVIKCHYRTPKYVDMGIKLIILYHQFRNKNYNEIPCNPKIEIRILLLPSSAQAQALTGLSWL